MRDESKKVIIVGNSPSILLKKNGSLIDSHDLVIRVNKCVTKGYEDYIGQKTNIWATTSNFRWNNFVPDKYNCLNEIWLRTPSTQLTLPKKPSNIPMSIMYKTKGDSQNINSIKKLLADRSKFISLIKNLKHEPCTGLLSILTAIRLYKNVSILGFTFNTEQKDGKAFEYYRPDEVKGTGEDPMDKENEYNLNTRGNAGPVEGIAKLNIISYLYDEKIINILNLNEIKGLKI